MVEDPLYINWHFCGVIYLCIAAFIIGIYLNYKLGLLNILIGRKEPESIMKTSVKGICEEPEEFEVGDDCYNVSIALMHEKNNEAYFS